MLCVHVSNMECLRDVMIVSLCVGSLGCSWEMRVLICVCLGLTLGCILGKRKYTQLTTSRVHDLLLY
jgi:hypothetical protein